MRRWNLFLATLCSTMACTSGTTRPPKEYLVGPLASLPGIALGMTVGELRTLRPSVRDAPYTGLIDSVGRYAIYFLVANVEEDPARSTAKLREVRATRRFADSMSAKAEEHELLNALGSETLCRIFRTDATRRERVVSSGNQEIAVRYSMNLQDEYGRDTTHYRVAINWRKKERLSAAEEGIPCASE